MNTFMTTINFVHKQDSDSNSETSKYCSIIIGRTTIMHKIHKSKEYKWKEHLPEILGYNYRHQLSCLPTNNPEMDLIATEFQPVQEQYVLVG